MSEAEDKIRRLVVSAERMHAAVLGLCPWAAGVFPGQLPKPLQRVIDAAKDYERSLGEFTAPPPAGAEQ